MSSFFQLSKQLPTGALTEVDLEFEEDDVTENLCAHLKEDQLKTLNVYYRNEDREYGALNERY